MNGPRCSQAWPGPRGWKHLKVGPVHRTFCNTGAHKGCPGAWARPAALPGAHPWGCQDALSPPVPGNNGLTWNSLRFQGGWKAPPAHGSGFPGREAAAGGARSPKDSGGQGGAPCRTALADKASRGLPAPALLTSYSNTGWSLLRNSDIRARRGQSPLHASLWAQHVSPQRADSYVRAANTGTCQPGSVQGVRAASP